MLGKSVGSIIGGKKIQELITVPASAMVSEAVATMSQKGVGAILIRNRGDAIEGIFTERDLMVRVVGAGRDPKSTPIGSVMSPQVRHVDASMIIEDALTLMVVHGYRHLLVETGGKIEGIVSLRDFMASMVVPDVPIAHEGRVGVTRARAEATLQVVAGMKPGSGPER
jgi:CBS domain-containing protein